MPDWCRCELEVRGPEAEVARFVAAAGDSGTRSATGGKSDEAVPPEAFYFDSLYPVPEDVLADESPGAVSDWEEVNWGVDSGACYSEVVWRCAAGVRYRFRTRYGLPRGFLNRVAADWPALAFCLIARYVVPDAIRRATVRWEGGTLASNVDEEVGNEDAEEIEESLASTEAG